MTTLRSLVDHIPPHLAYRLRGAKNWRRLHGLHGPPRLLIDWIARDAAAIDVGANFGLYTYWLSKRAASVHAFEPVPELAAYLRVAAPSSVSVYEVALSDRAGAAQLTVPPNNGEASLRQGDVGVRRVLVRTAALDDFAIRDVGFIKIDVEGHESAVLAGASETIAKWRPVVFVECERRHGGDPIALASSIESQFAYRGMFYLQNGAFRDLADFDLERDQVSLEACPGQESYVSNFLFLPG